jgi:hypothetical protein
LKVFYLIIFIDSFLKEKITMIFKSWLTNEKKRKIFILLNKIKPKYEF